MFGTLDELIRYVQKLHGMLLFRGQPSAKYGLLPSVGRPHRRYKPSAEVEQDLFQQFRLKSRAFIDHATTLEALIIARHYGLRTRILDWTSNLYTALYFATDQRESDSTFPLTIYIARNPRIRSFYDLPKDPFKISQTEFFEPPHLDRRIANQSAFLSIHHSPLRDWSANYVERFSLYPYPNTREEISRTLLNIGIRHSTVYPGMDSLCRDINDNPKGTPPALLFEDKARWRDVPKSWIGKSGGEIWTMLVDGRAIMDVVDAVGGESILGIPVERAGAEFGRIFALSQEECSEEIWIHRPRLVRQR